MKNIFKKRSNISDPIEAEEDGGTKVCGGTQRTLSNSAEKTIKSNEIVNFELEFSLYSYVLDDAEIEDGFFGYFILSCKRTNDGAECRYIHRDRYDLNDKKDFVAGADFLVELDKIVKDEDLAIFNGYSSHTYGLPDMFGAELNVDYASGENIYTSDNQSIDIPFSALKRTKALFESAMGKKSDSKPATDKADDEPEDFPSSWMCGACGTINHSASDFCSNCGMPKPGVDPKAHCPCGLDFFGEVPDSCPECGLDRELFE